MTSNVIAVYPGTFDPMTLGHEDVVRRATQLFSRVIVAVAAGHHKKALFTLQERIDMARQVQDAGLRLLELNIGTPYATQAAKGAVATELLPERVSTIVSAVRAVAALEERNREAAERIRALMFVFEDLNKLDPGGVQTLLRAVEKDQLGLALKGSSDGLREMFFSNMSERAAKIMREDMESMGPVRLRDVDAAQMAMVQVAKDLAAKGEIMLAGAGGDDELIY